MTERELELRLRGWYRAEVPIDEAAPSSLRASVATIPRTRRGDLIRLPDRRYLRLAVAALVALALVATILIGAGGLPAVLPTPSPTLDVAPPSIVAPLPSTAASQVPRDAPSAVVYSTDQNTATISLLDVTTGATSVLGGLPVDGKHLRVGTYARVRWSIDRSSVRVVQVSDGETIQATLDVASRQVITVDGGMQSISPVAAFGVRLSGDIVVMDTRGNTIRHLALPEDATVQDPGPISPDGASVVLSGCSPCNLLGKNPGTSTHMHLYVVALDGGAVRVLADAVSNSFIVAANWSPDGAAIAVAHRGIATIDARTGELRQLTTNENDEQPVWSDDGTRIAFVRRSGADRGIWVIDAAGGGARRLTTAQSDDGDRLPVWSPDGSTLLFSRGSIDVFGDVWQVPSSGGTGRLVARNAIADW